MWPFCKHNSSSTCPNCNAFAGGLVGGFFFAPARWLAGGQRMQSQGGLILAEPGRTEEEENKLLGKEIRTVGRLLVDREARDTASEMWNAFPLQTRERLTASGFSGLGNLAGSLGATRVAIFGLSFLGARMLTLHPRLRPLGVLGSTGRWTAQTILAALSFQGTAEKLMREQRDIFNRYPGSRDALSDTLDQVVDLPRKDPPS